MEVKMVPKSSQSVCVANGATPVRGAVNLYHVLIIAVTLLAAGQPARAMDGADDFALPVVPVVEPSTPPSGEPPPPTDPIPATPVLSVAPTSIATPLASAAGEQGFPTLESLPTSASGETPTDIATALSQFDEQFSKVSGNPAGLEALYKVQQDIYVALCEWSASVFKIDWVKRTQLPADTAGSDYQNFRFLANLKELTWNRAVQIYLRHYELWLSSVHGIKLPTLFAVWNVYDQIRYIVEHHLPYPILVSWQL
jgi:hypothetical protein